MNKLVQGFGINDMKNMSKTKVYNTWSNMLRRCYSEKYLEKHPTYNKVFVSVEWKKLSDFKKWFDKYNIEGYDLDKDIYIPGNYIYSPNRCVYAPHYINMMVISQETNNKLLGARYTEQGKWFSTIKIYNNEIHLGFFNSEIEAHRKYIQTKVNYFLGEADKWTEKNYKIAVGLHRHVKNIFREQLKKTLDCYN